MYRLFQGFSQQALFGVPDGLAILVSMSNMYEGISPDDMPTGPYRSPGGSGTGNSGPGGSGPGKGARSRGKWAAALLAVCAAVGGGTFAVVQAVTGSPAAAQAANTRAATAQTGTPQTGTSASVSGQAAALRDVLTRTGAWRLARLRRLGGMYGQYTYETSAGPRTLAFERGIITDIGSADVVVRAADGTTWTWVLTGTSVVRENGTREPETMLAQGETVFAGGPVTDGTRDAWLVVIRKAAATSPGTAGTA